jgi:hypothetical protein
MRKFRRQSITTLAAVIIVTFAMGCSVFPNDPLQGNLKVFPGNSDEGFQPPSSPPVASPPSVQVSTPTERSIVITESNSVFSIGIPAGYKEERQVFAEKPVDYWFEYVSPETTLQINGIKVEVPIRRTGARLGYTAGVTSFSYVMVNPTSQMVSYNLRITPSKKGEQVPASTIEKWTAP